MKRTLDATQEKVLTKKLCYYSPTKAKTVIENSKNIIASIAENQTERGCKFVNVFDKTFVIAPYITLNSIQDINCLAIDNGYSYKIPLYFDVDCLLCKNNNNQHSIETLNCFTHILSVLQDLLREIDFTDYEIYKSNTECGFHVYFHTDVDVSLPVYFVITDKINKDFKEFGLHLEIDIPQYLPLPNSAKQDDLFYSRIYESKATEKKYGYADKFYDYPIEIKKSISISKTALGIITVHKDISILDTDFWLKDLNKNIIKNYIVSDLTTLTIIDECPKIINTITNGDSHIYPLRLFINKNNNNINKPQDVSLVEDEDLAYILNTLGGKVATCLNYADMQNNQHHFLQLLQQPNNTYGYSFHLIIIVLCLYKNYKQVDVEDLPNTVKTLKRLCNKIYPNQPKINNIFKALLKYNVLGYFESLYRPNISKIMNFIINMMQPQTPQSLTSICGDDNIKYKYTIELLRNTFYVKKIHGILHHWVDGVYVKIKDKESPFYLMLNNCIIDIKQCIQFDNKNYYKKVENTFLSTIEDSSATPNLYRFFVNTKLGIFNSLCGVYMTHVPSIIFTKMKEYCIESDFNPQSNKLLIGIENGIVEKTIKKSIILSGLLNICQVYCDESMFNFIIKYIHENLHLFTHNDLEYMIKKLVNMYNIKTQAINKIYDSIILLYNEKSEIISLDSILRMHKQYYQHTENDSPELDISDGFSKVDIKLYFYSYSLCVLVLNYDSIKSQSFIDYFDIVPQSPKIDEENYSFKTKTLECNPIYRELKTVLSSREAKLALFLFPLFNFDGEVLLELLKSCSVLYQPQNDNKKFLLFVGPPNSGKSQLCSLLERSNLGNTFKKFSAFPKTKIGQGPEPNIIAVYEHALTILSEVQSIDASQIKAVTGGDSSHLRALYENQQRLYSPTCLVVGATNNTININVDEAIRYRLAPFSFSIKFNQVNVYDNIFSYLMKKQAPSVTFDLNELSIEFNNLLYSTYCKYRDSDGNIYSKIKNKKSINLIRNILIKNSDIYKFMFDNNLDFMTTANIKYTEFKTKFDVYIEKEPSFKFTFDRFLMILLTNFNIQKTDDLLIGLGEIENIEVNSKNNYSVKQKPGNKMHLVTIKKIIKNQIDFQNFTVNYKKNIKGNIVFDLEITTV